MSNSIVVNVPSQEKNKIAFIAAPYSNEFAALLRIIDDALLLGLFIPYRVNRAQDNACFVEDVISNIQKCGILIGVCTPENGLKDANPNVMYELGIGRSIGKPILLLTNDIKTMPSDVLVHHTVFEYERDEEYRQNTELINRLAVNIHKIQDRIRDSYIDNSYHPDIWVGKTDYLMLKHPAIWNAFVKGVTVSRSLRKELQEYDSIHMKGILPHISDYYISKKNNTKQVESLKQSWSTFTQLYILREGDFLNYKKVIICYCNELNCLCVQIKNSDLLILLKSCIKFIDAISILLDKFIPEHTEIINKTAEQLLQELETREKHICNIIKSLSFNAKTLITYLDSLVYNILGVYEKAEINSKND